MSVSLNARVRPCSWCFRSTKHGLQQEIARLKAILWAVFVFVFVVFLFWEGPARGSYYPHTGLL